MFRKLAVGRSSLMAAFTVFVPVRGECFVNKLPLIIQKIKYEVYVFVPVRGECFVNDYVSEYKRYL